MTAAPSTHHEILPNGLTLLLRETHLSPVASLQIWVNVGSADERSNELGLAHFHEHMLFKGTPNRGVGDVAAEVEGAGGRINAYTSFDVTVYHATLPREALAVGLDVLSDAVQHSIFDPEEVVREREVVLEEIRRSQDSPFHVLSDAVFAEAYRVHPYRNPILGTAESVSSFHREQVMTFFERWYTPDNMVVVAAGDFDAAEFALEIAAAFEGAQPGGTLRARPTEPKNLGLRSVVLQQPFERVRLDLSWAGTSFRDDDSTALDLLSFILGESESSRLVQRVKDREALVDRIDSSSYSPLDPGLISITAETDVERAAACLDAVSREVERLRHEPVSSDELERARANFLASEHFERESVSGLASKLGSFHVLGGDWRSEERYFEGIRQATADDLLRVARQYLNSEQLTAGVMLPPDLADTQSTQSSPSRQAAPVTRAIEEADVAAAIDAGISRTRRRFSPPTETKRGERVHSFQLHGGASLHVLPQRDVPVVAARAAFSGGLIADEEPRAGLSSFLASMWTRGTRQRSAGDFARTVENLAAEVEGFAGRNSQGVVLEITSDKLSEGLDLFTEVILEPAFDADEFEREQRETLAAIERREDRLAQRAFLLFGEAHYKHHPYRLSMIGSHESVTRFDLDAVRAHHARVVQAENLVIGLSGDVDPEAVAEALSVRLEALPHGDFVQPAPAAEEAPNDIREVSLHKDRAQTHIVLGFRGLTVHDPGRHVLEVIAQLLAGQGGRLFLELRDRRGLAYSVSASNLEGVAPGFFSVYIATAPEKANAARDGILEQLERVIAEPPSDDELARARRYLTGSFAIDQQRNSARAAHISLDALYGLGPEAYLSYAKTIESVTKEDVLRVAQRILRLDAYTIATVGDLNR